MARSLLCTLLLVFVSLISIAQVMPAEGGKLNYRIVGFSVPLQPKVKSYQLEIAEGNVNNEEYFKKYLIISKANKDNKIIATVPQFGKEYTWRVKYLNKKGKTLERSAFYHFATNYHKAIDTSIYQLKILTKDTVHRDMLVLFDNPSVMYDIDGNPVWYLPDSANVVTDNRSMRDLKPTSAGTFTCVSDFGIFEFDYNGRVIWKGPNDGKISGDSVEGYHHEFTRLDNGNYMTLGDEKVVFDVPDGYEKFFLSADTIRNRNKDPKHQKISCGTVIEYDPSGKVVWYWKSSAFFKNINYLKNVDIFAQNKRGPVLQIHPHLNAVFFNTEDSFIYASFKNISTILKIKYPSGEVVNVYGRLGSADGSYPFKFQHNCQINSKNQLYLFDNNTDRDMRGTSFVSYFDQPASGNTLEKVWTFSCNIDTFAATSTGVGGGVYELPDSNILVSMGAGGRAFIVSPDKKITWNAVPRNCTYEKGKWIVTNQYRTSYLLNPEALNKFIFK